MELKEIFRHEERRLYPEAADLQRRYVRLRHRFEQFVRCFLPGELRDFPIDGVEFSPEPDKPLLVARFCGKKYRFCFDMIDQGARGQVRCLVSSSNDEEDSEPEELGRFTFNGDGITNITPPPEGDPLPIHEGGAPFGIIVSFLIAAF